MRMSLVEFIPDALCNSRTSKCIFRLPRRCPIVLPSPGWNKRVTFHSIQENIPDGSLTFHVPSPMMGMTAPVMSFTDVAIASAGRAKVWLEVEARNKWAPSTECVWFLSCTASGHRRLISDALQVAPGVKANRAVIQRFYSRVSLHTRGLWYPTLYYY